MFCTAPGSFASGFFLLFVLLPAIVPVLLLVLLIIVVVRSRQQKPAAVPPGTPSLGERSATLRRKSDHYQEERSRILGMVEHGTVSPEEADRLFETLERETITMACPFCGEEIRAEARKCKHCRCYLVGEMLQPRRLTKSHDKVLAGVCGGVANYFNLDPSLVRVMVALVVFFSGIVTGLLVYLVAALVIPEDS